MHSGKLMDNVKEAEINNEEWMSCLPEKLWDVPLTNLSIPGSHDAMSYCLDITSPLIRSESDTFRLLDGVFCCFTRPAIYRWATTQAGIYLKFVDYFDCLKCLIFHRRDTSVSPIALIVSVYLMCKFRHFYMISVFVTPYQSPLLCCEQVQDIVEQLTAGIRYFDLRIAHKPYDSSNELYFTHVIYTHATVIKTLQTVASWLESHPKEIIILACSHFEGLDHKLHEEFIYSLKKIFGSKLCPRNEVLLTLRSLWTSGYQVVLSYEDQSAARHVDLWPAIPYLWANKPNAEELLQYLEWQKQLGRPEGFFVAGLNLTTDRCFITSHPRESLQTLTMENWNCVRKWLEDQKPGAEPTSLNIIAGDFIGPVPLCSIVIALNKKLL